MKRKALIVVALLLTLLVGAAVAQRVKKHGGLVDILSTGRIVLTPRSGQSVVITGPATVSGAATFSSTVATGALSSTTGAFSSTLGVTGVTTATGGLSVGAGSGTLLRLATGTASLDFTALAANTCETLTITVTNSTVGSSVALGLPDALADVDGATESTVFTAWISANGTVSVRRCNVTETVTADPAAATVRATVLVF